MDRARLIAKIPTDDGAGVVGVKSSQAGSVSRTAADVFNEPARPRRGGLEGTPRALRPAPRLLPLGPDERGAMAAAPDRSGFPALARSRKHPAVTVAPRLEAPHAR